MMHVARIVTVDSEKMLDKVRRCLIVWSLGSLQCGEALDKTQEVAQLHTPLAEGDAADEGLAPCSDVHLPLQAEAGSLLAGTATEAAEARRVQQFELTGALLGAPRAQFRDHLLR